jgi:hypothetical protein
MFGAVCELRCELHKHLCEICNFLSASNCLESVCIFVMEGLVIFEHKKSGGIIVESSEVARKTLEDLKIVIV